MPPIGERQEGVVNDAIPERPRGTQVALGLEIWKNWYEPATFGKAA